jgi:hypothetical protein
VRACVVDGNECFVEGAAYNEGELTATFLAHVTLADDGLIERYLALMAAAHDA